MPPSPAPPLEVVEVPVPPGFVALVLVELLLDELVVGVVVDELVLLDEVVVGVLVLVEVLLLVVIEAVVGVHWETSWLMVDAP